MRRKLFRIMVGLSAVLTLLVVSDTANAQKRREPRGRSLKGGPKNNFWLVFH